MTTQPDEPVPILEAKQPWMRSLCPKCGRLNTGRRLIKDSPAARQATYDCQSGHHWSVTWGCE